MNNKLKPKIMEIVNNQLNINEPKCTKETYDRLVGLGFTEEQAKEMIGKVLVEEMYTIMKNQIPFNLERYEQKLSKLN